MFDLYMAYFRRQLGPHHQIRRRCLASALATDPFP
jgi:hypothetical protein